MILRGEVIAGEGVLSMWESPRLGGWPTIEAASKTLRAKAAWLMITPLICGGYETQTPHPATGFRERITFWPDYTA